MLKALTIATAGLGALYSSYWFIGATAVERAATTAVETLRADGWTVSFDDLSTRGFPNRFDTIATAPILAAPGGVPAWQAEAIGLYALSYRPNSVIALFPEIQEITLLDQDITLTTTAMKASAKVQAATALPLDNVTLETGPALAASTAGWELILDHALAAFRISGPAPFTYDLYFGIDAPGLDGLDAPGIALDRIAVDAQITLDAALDRNSTAPALVGITLRDARIELGTARIVATGTLTFTAAGLGNGQIDVTAVEWDSLIGAFETAGLLDAGRATAFRGALTAMAGGTAQVVAPITVIDGQARLGFLPLGEVRIAPRN